MKDIMKVILVFLTMSLVAPNVVSAYEYKADYNQKFNAPKTTQVTVPNTAPVQTQVIVIQTPSTSATSQSLPAECSYANAVIVLELSDWSVTPSSSYVKEGDKVCLIVEAKGTVGSSFSLQNHAVGGSIQPGKSRVWSFYARKKGTWDITCNGTCRDSKATFNVLPKEQFQRMEDKRNLENSINTRPRNINGGL
ncbi:MAG: cupredoxin domain-containing protein [Bdellovibrionaceae bacterium]|nr:cupredoxin domain-containing protein [Pseudobdellovibrionaceae bacterium]